MTQPVLAEGIISSETPYPWVLDNLHDVVVLMDANGTVLEQSPSGERVFGHSGADIAGRDGWAFVHPEDLEGLRATFARVVATPQTTMRHEYRLRHRDGSWRHVETVGINMLDSPGVGAIVAVTRDVTDRENAVRALRRSEERFHAAFDHATVGMAILSPLGRVLEANRALGAMLGRGGTGLRNTGLADFAPPEERPQHEALFHRFLTGEADAEVAELRFLCPDGMNLWLELSLTLQRDATGAPLHVVLVAQDVSGRRTAEAAERRLAALLQLSDDAMVGTDPEGLINSWNPAARELFGYEEHEAIGRPVLDLVPPELRAHVSKLLAGLRQGRTFVEPDTLRLTRSGDRVRVALWVSPVRDAAGETVGACGIARRLPSRGP